MNREPLESGARVLVDVRQWRLRHGFTLSLCASYAASLNALAVPRPRLR
jgi:hypothetical protein